MLMLSNPTKRSGKFYEIFTDNTGYPEWQRHSMTRLTTGYEIIALSSHDKAEKIKKTWEHRVRTFGKEHPDIRIEILGEFPLADNTLAFPMELIEHVGTQDPFYGKKEEIKTIVIGVDIAGMGGDLIVFTQNNLNYDFYHAKERIHKRPKEFFDVVSAYSRQDVRKLQSYIVIALILHQLRM